MHRQVLQVRSFWLGAFGEVSRKGTYRCSCLWISGTTSGGYTFLKKWLTSPVAVVSGASLLSVPTPL